MKAKMLGLVSVSVLALSALGTGGYHGAPYLGLFSDPFAAAPQESGFRAPLLPEVPSIDPILADKIQTVLPRLAQLRNPQQSNVGAVDMLRLGFSQKALLESRMVANQTMENFSERIISMAYVSGANRFTVIDGSFYQEGDELIGSGGRIRTITPEKVLISGREIRQWVPVENRVTTVVSDAPDITTVTPPASATPGVAPAQSGTGASPSIAEGLQQLQNYNTMIQQAVPAY